MRLRFGPFCMDLDRYELSRDGEPLEIQPRSFDVLRYLLENAERTVGKRELLDRLWPGVAVGEAALTTAVRQARRALGEWERDAAILQTLRRRGYRIGVPVTREGDAPAAPAPGPPPAPSPPELEAPREPVPEIPGSKGALEGERKQLTVLFADVKGSMELAEQLDPEEWRGILERFFAILGDGVRRFEGTVNQYTGDGIMALFGAPIAHENHAQRACYAALWLRDALRRYSDELRRSQGLDFAARMGIHTGEVVVGEIGDDQRRDYAAQGHAVGLAARMESLAPANGVCVSEATARLVSGYVTLRDLGASEIKGASEPVRVFALEGMGELHSHFDRARARGLTRFVGRDDDMAVLEQALEQARRGNGHVVGVVAEAGAGKSRLCFEFVERCRERGIRVLQGAGVAHGKHIPFLPILEVLRQAFGIGEQEAEGAAREKIEGRLLQIDEGLRALLPVVFDFLAVADPERPAPAADPGTRQRQLFDAMRRVLASGEGTTVVFIEDLHWIDAGSEAWVRQLVEAAAGSSTLLLVNFRPDYHGAWMQKSWYRQLPLLPLSPEATRELLADLLGSDPSIEGLADAVHQRTAGNPFFAEEIVQDLIESGSLEGGRGAYRLVTPVDELEVPGSVQSVLAARIDRLAEREKRALQAASVIGREFSEPILSAVLDWPAGDLSDALHALRDGEFVYERSLYPVAEYAFKHPLTQEVALGSQLHKRRARTHAAVARALEAAHPDRLDENAALLAHHYEGAGEALEAGRWHLRAAHWRMLDFDLTLHFEHLRRAYELAKSEPATPESMELQAIACAGLVLSSPWVGRPMDERERLAAEGRAVAERLGDRANLCRLEFGVGAARMMAGWSDEGPLAPTERAVAIAADLPIDLRIAAREQRDNTLFHMGRVPEALRVSEETLELIRCSAGPHPKLFGASSESNSLWRIGSLLMWSGRPAEAAAAFDSSLKLGDERGDEDALAWLVGLWSGPPFEELTGTSRQALARCQRGLEVAERSGAPFLLVGARQYLAWAQLMRGMGAEALDSLLRVDHLHRERGILSVNWNLAEGLLAEAYLAVGDVKNARLVANRCTVDRDTWVFELRANLSRARVLRALDGADGRTEIEASLDQAAHLLEKSGARAFAPLIVEERARLLEVLGDSQGARRTLHEAKQAFSEVDATGHVDRLAKELGA